MLLWSKCGLSEKGKCLKLIPIPADTGKRRQLLTHGLKQEAGLRGFGQMKGIEIFVTGICAERSRSIIATSLRHSLVL